MNLCKKNQIAFSLLNVVQENYRALRVDVRKLALILGAFVCLEGMAAHRPSMRTCGATFSP